MFVEVWTSQKYSRERVSLTESGHGDKRLGFAVFLKNFASGGGGFKAMQ